MRTSTLVPAESVPDQDGLDAGTATVVSPSTWTVAVVDVGVDTMTPRVHRMGGGAGGAGETCGPSASARASLFARSLMRPAPVVS